MAAVEWLPSEDGSHAVVMGDLVTLCGGPAFLLRTASAPGPVVCPTCAELVLTMAVALGYVQNPDDPKAVADV